MRRALALRRSSGLLLIVAGALLNPWLLGAVLVPDGEIRSTSAKAAILLFDGMLLAAGWFLFASRTPLLPLARRILPAGLIMIALTEAGLRILGYQPWTPPDIRIEVEPGGRFFRPHPTLGFQHLPGRFRVTLPTGYRFQVAHDAEGFRATSPGGGAGPAPGAPEVWIFGCSFTHGWTVEDEEHWPWIVQQSMEDVRIANFAVDGYGTLQSWIQFREALARGRRPAAALVAYASFHDPRNTFVRHRRKDVAPVVRLGPLRQPFARFDGSGSIAIGMSDVDYVEFPLMRHSALAHQIEILYNRFEERVYGRSGEVTRWILSEWAGQARESGVRFGVLGILGDDLTREVGEFCSAASIPFGDISVDLDVPANTNLPHDPHPSAAAHRAYAEKALPFIARLLDR